MKDESTILRFHGDEGYFILTVKRHHPSYHPMLEDQVISSIKSFLQKEDSYIITPSCPEGVINVKFVYTNKGDSIDITK